MSCVYRPFQPPLGMSEDQFVHGALQEYLVTRPPPKRFIFLVHLPGRNEVTLLAGKDINNRVFVATSPQSRGMYHRTGQPSCTRTTLSAVAELKNEKLHLALVSLDFVLYMSSKVQRKVACSIF